MIPRTLAKELVKRFSGKQGWPSEVEAVRALVDAFEKAPRNEAHARQVAEDLEIDSRYCPEPSEVWKIARATDPAGFWQGCGAAPPDGPHCIHTREEYLADRDVIALAKTFGVPVESLWPLDGESEPEPEAIPAPFKKAPPNPFGNEYRDWAGIERVAEEDEPKAANEAAAKGTA